MKHASLGALLAVALAGCATTAKFEAKMNGFVGQPESAVVGTYGPPQRTYDLKDGSRVLQYTRGGSVTLPGATTYVPVQSNTSGTLTVNRGLSQSTGNYSAQTTTMVPQQSAPISLQQYCTVNFTVDAQGIVRRWAAEGNYCVSDG